MPEIKKNLELLKRGVPARARERTHVNQQAHEWKHKQAQETTPVK